MGSIFQIFRKELLLEWRNRSAFFSMLLYVAGAVMIVYMAFQMKSGFINPIVWNTVFWIILLFTIVNSSLKIFTLESPRRNHYYYYVLKPENVMVAKILYTVLINLIIGGFLLLIYSFLIEPVGAGDFWSFIGHPEWFALTVLLGILSLSTTLTFISGISAAASGGGSLMAILSFPLAIPQLVILIRLCNKCIDGLNPALFYTDFLVLGAIIVLVGALSYVLFPYLWRS